MKSESDDVIFARPRTISSRVAWLMAVGLLAASLAAAITAAFHYRDEAAALQRRPVRSVPAARLPGTAPPALATATIMLPSSRAVRGEVTVFSASSGRLAQIMVSAQITGGRPHTRYELIGFNCQGTPAAYQTWATGVTDAGGRGTLSGEALAVSLRHDYWFYLRLPSQISGSGLLGSFTAAGKFSASRAGNPACR
ncbi:MAG: hypothetical protein ACR2MP_10710 [Streptosporangiaceae bacterium]